VTHQALFYDNAVPLNPSRHGDWHVDARAGFAFSRHANSVPLTLVEFEPAAREYPIVFVAGESGVAPVAVLGLQDRENLYIGEDGGWRAEYIPAYVRRYPFVFSTSDGGKNFTVCIDEAFVGCNQEGKGERLFVDGQARSPFLEGVLAFLKEYERQYRATRAFCRRLEELNLLEPMQAKVELKTGGKRSLSGFSTVSRDRLKGIEPGALHDLLAADELEHVFAHLFSLRAFTLLMDRLPALEG